MISLLAAVCEKALGPLVSCLLFTILLEEQGVDVFAAGPPFVPAQQRIPV